MGMFSKWFLVSAQNWISHANAQTETINNGSPNG